MKIISLIIITFLPFTIIQSQNSPNKSIKIAHLESYTPNDFMNQNDKSLGFASDYSGAIMGILNMPFEIVNKKINLDIHNNDSYIDELLTDCDLAISINKPNQEKEHIYYSIPYTSINYDVLVRDTTYFNNINNITDKGIIVKRKSSVQKKIEESGNELYKHIIYVNNIDMGIKLLSEGSGDFLICDEITSQKLSKIKLENNIATYPSNLPPLEIVFAAKDENLINEINNALGKLETKNTYELLYNKWYGVKEAKSASWYVYTIIAIIAAIIILLLFIIYILKKMVHKATLESKSSYNKILELNQSINFLIKNSNVEIFIYDDQEMMLYSLEGEDYIKKSLSLDDLIKYIHNEDRKQYNNMFQDFLQGELEIMILKLRIFNPTENKYFYYEYVIKPLKKDYTGKVYRFIFSRKDETEKQERMQKQDELIQSFNLALKSAKLARWEYNIETKEILITRSDTTQLYLKKDEIYNYILPTDKKVFDEYIVNVILLKKEESIILRLRRIDGTQYATCEMSSLVKYDSDFNPVAIYGIIKDLSDIKLVQQKVFELQYNMQLALDAGELSIWQYDKLNNEYINLYGNPLNGGRMTQKECLQYIHPDDSQIISDGIQNILNKKTDKITVQHRMDILSPGQWRWYACSMIAMPSDDDIRYIIGTRRDITQEIEYKKKLEEMNQKLELSYQQIDETLKYLTTILDKLPIPIYIKDPLEQKHIYINEEACKLYFTETNSTVSDLIIPENAEQCELIDKQITESGEDYSAYEVIHFKNGRIMNTYVKKALITYNNKKLILAVRTDLTHQHKSLINKKMISNSVPLLKAYTWSYTSKDNVINFGETFVHNQRNIYDINTVEKFISIIHPEDQKTCKSIIQEYLKKGNGEYAFSYRMDLYQKGVYEWWQSKSVVETIHDINGSYILVYGVEVNINDKMNNLINN